ncbi:MAG: hypothetical protein CFH05_01163 [Alphaproteobacteria bacterium MarineAlpha3_Bin4]|nr:MAG: hypothetical protein CFH05_01163 [Alphaproteobacteria bacterium MarineAlpha3_Bin4]
MKEDGEKRLEFKVSRGRCLHGIIISALLMVIGILAVSFGDAHIQDSGWVGTVCFAVAAGVLYVSRGFWTGGVAMTIDNEGIWYRDWQLPVVPWGHVANVYSDGIRLRPLLRIDLNDAQVFFASLDDESRRGILGNTLIKKDRLFIPNNAVDKSITDLITAIKAFRGGAKP